jgi:hypothetical protein
METGVLKGQKRAFYGKESIANVGEGEKHFLLLSSESSKRNYNPNILQMDL